MQQAADPSRSLPGSDGSAAAGAGPAPARPRGTTGRRAAAPPAGTTDRRPSGPVAVRRSRPLAVVGGCVPCDAPRTAASTRGWDGRTNPHPVIGAISFSAYHLSPRGSSPPLERKPAVRVTCFVESGQEAFELPRTRPRSCRGQHGGVPGRTAPQPRGPGAGSRHGREPVMEVGQCRRTQRRCTATDLEAIRPGSDSRHWFRPEGWGWIAATLRGRPRLPGGRASSSYSCHFFYQTTGGAARPPVIWVHSARGAGPQRKDHRCSSRTR